MQEFSQKISVIGLGYIGLPTASLLATKGYHVYGVDIRKKVVDTINAGNIHIIEADLDIMVRSAVQSGNLRAGLTPEVADIFLLTVPTPFKDEHQPDLTYIRQAVENIAPVLVNGNLVIVESTCPVDTTAQVQQWFRELRPDITELYLAYCPERVLPGRILEELVSNDRVVGGIDQASTEKALAFYRSFVHGELLATDAKTAAMCKLSENAFRDVNIAFANELSRLCEQFDINPWEVVRLANRHPRVNILQPGPGVGGHCIAVDPWFLVAQGEGNARLIQTAREVNDAKPEWVVEKVKQAAAQFENPIIACLGLSYKADIDDLRESPALMITKKLKAADVGYVLACEPNVESVEDLELASLDELIKTAHVCVFLVNHREFRTIDKEILKDKIVLDFCGVFQ